MTSSQVATPSPQNGNQSPLLFLLLLIKILQSLGVAALIFCSISAFIMPGQFQRFLIYDAALAAGLIFLFLLNGQLDNFAKGIKADLKRKAIIYTKLLPQKDAAGGSDAFNDCVEAREKALEYSQELIDDYKKVRKVSRNYYYIFQISTIILSGVTPILVLVDKQESIPYLRWLPVIFPALAAIVTSISTSFPFQERWVNANQTVEKLEAEQEKFVLGVTEPYRAFNLVQDDKERLKKVKIAIENFIIAVNQIHLKQLDSSAGSQEKEAPTAGNRDE
ncbi:MAG: DUF4231 domain-containing protein [Cyanobacteria bacterium P01_E01_bin.42]